MEYDDLSATILNILFMLSNLILTVVPRDGYYPHFTGKEAKAEKSQMICPRLHSNLVSGTVEIQTHLCYYRTWNFNHYTRVTSLTGSRPRTPGREVRILEGD